MYKFKTKPFQHQLTVYEESKDTLAYAFFMEMGTGKSKVAIDTMGHLYLENKIIGRTTSGNYSFCFDKNLSFGYVNSGNTIETLRDKNLFIEIEKIKYPVEIISKPLNREEALVILKKLNGQKHQLISSVCISKNGSMIWNYTDIATLTMKQMSDEELKSYLDKIKDKELYAYNVYQIEGEGRSLFSKIEGDENTIMGLPINQIKEYLNSFK